MKKGFFITLGGSLLILSFNIVSGIITARALGPQGKGILRTFVIWPVLFSQIATLGLNESYIYLKNRNYDTIKLKSVILYGVLISSIIFSLVLFIAYSFFYKSIIKTFYMPILISTYVPVANLIQVGLSFMQERMAFLRYNLYRLFVPFFYLVLLLMNFKSLSPKKCFIYLLISNFILLFLILHEFKKLSPKYISMDYLKESFNFGIKTQFASIIGSISQQSDQAVLSLISTPKILGIYSVGVSISRIGNLAPYAAQLVLYPKMAKEKKYNIKKNIIRLFIFNFILYLIIIATLQKLILLFYGPKFNGATKIAFLLFATSFPLSIIYVGNAYFKSIGKPVKTTIGQIIVFFSLLLLTPFLYLLFGPLGVATGSVIAYSLGAIYYILNFKKNGTCK